jgi:hypothetical protein
MDDADQLKRDLSLLTRLSQERTSWETHWRDIADYFLPRSLRTLCNERNQGNKRSSKILNSTTTRAARILAAGMFASITSPARPWFSLTLADRIMAKQQAVKEWLDDVTKILRDILAGSNFYRSAPAMFRDLGTFGTHASIIDEDDQDVVRFYPLIVGSYWLACSERQAVDTLVRKYSMTVRQMANKFGIDACPQNVQNMHKDGKYEEWIDGIVQVIGPNPDHNPNRLDSRHKRVRSVYFMESNHNDQYLRKSGYDTFPGIAPRWETNGEDVYGTSPGMVALPDARSLMVYEKRIAQAIEKKVNPPLIAPVELENKGGVNPTPGATTFANVANMDKIKSIYDAGAFQVEHAANKAEQIKADINASLYVDLFLMLINSDRRQVTAEEIRAKQEEKILALGEPLERLNEEALSPVIDRVFDIASRRGMLPPPPREIQGMPITVEYVSVLHQVQKMVALGQIDRLAQFVGGLAGVFPSVVDKFDADQAVDEYAEALGTSPRIVRSDEQVDEIRQARAQAQAQQQAEVNSANLVQGAKTLSETDTGGQNALTDLMRGMSTVSA